MLQLYNTLTNQKEKFEPLTFFLTLNLIIKHKTKGCDKNMPQPCLILIILYLHD